MTSKLLGEFSTRYEELYDLLTKIAVRANETGAYAEAISALVVASNTATALYVQVHRAEAHENEDVGPDEAHAARTRDLEDIGGRGRDHDRGGGLDDLG